jgi:hypothetical protein
VPFFVCLLLCVGLSVLRIAWMGGVCCVLLYTWSDNKENMDYEKDKDWGVGHSLTRWLCVLNFRLVRVG